MLMKLRRAPKGGETLKLTLKLSCGCEIAVDAPVSKTAPGSK
jgi:copper(I)-binding protein